MNENKAPAEEWWTDDQKAIVEDSSSVWVKRKFEKVPGYWIPIDGGKMPTKLSKDENVPEGAILDDAAWDHEHCALCWQTISDYPTYQQEGYTDGENWLCVQCYEKYIEKATTD